ncbi:dihydrofolate reductase-like [Physella acuta]|uniref:dihydrofolate reductase-like n=1 Tax=Physella acuta TaxID=109671 RepID=UPI0027DD651E|nr:dihydrofolate reductase-like [Physella acuta]XP_059141204.1 dihydrofolate reductase-like [Physella acuta]
MPKLNIIVAACNNNGIGIEGRLPWRLKSDMSFFKQITLRTQDAEKKNAVIMGKNTWLSIPSKFRPLVGRINVVLSTQMTDAPEGTQLAKCLNQAVSLLESLNMAGFIEPKK